MAGSLPSLRLFTARRPSFGSAASLQVMGEWLRPERLRVEMNKSALKLARNLLIREISVGNRLEYLSGDNCEIRVLRSSENSRDGAVEIPLIDTDSGIVEIVVLKGILPYSLRNGLLQPHDIKALRGWQEQYQAAVIACNKNNKEWMASRTSQLRETADTVKDLKQYFMPQPPRAEKVPMFYHMPTLPENVSSEIPVFRPGDILDNRYEIKGFFQSGGIAALFNAKDIRSGEEVVIKIAPEQDLSGEIQALRRLTKSSAGNYFVRYKADGKLRGSLRYLALEKVEGESLADRISRGTLPLAEALDLMLRISHGLMLAAELGITHQDIKPDNILIREKTGEVVIIDLGLSLRGTGKGKPMGTPDYVSPEQLSDNAPVDHRSDIYSLGLMFYEMLSGAVPFSKGGQGTRADEIQMIKRRLKGEKLPRLGKISADASAAKMAQKIIAKMTKVKPRRRYGSYEKLIKALDKIRAKLDKGKEKNPRATLVYPLPAFVPFEYRVAKPLYSELGRLKLEGLVLLAQQAKEHYENDITVVYEAPAASHSNFTSRVAHPHYSEIPKLRSRGFVTLAALTDAYYEEGKTRVFSALSPAMFSLTGEFRPAADALLDEEADTQVF